MGDSRVSRLEDVWKKEKFCPPEWEAYFFEKKGGHLDDLPHLLGVRKNMNPNLNPEYIIVCGFLVDAIKMEPCSVKEEGRFLKLRPEVDEGDMFPALGGVRRKARAVWLEFKKIFRESKIVWTIPHPVDCERWRCTRGMRDVQVSFCRTWEDHSQCQGLSYRLVNYFCEIDKLVLDEFGNGYWSLPWAIFWRKQRRGQELSLEEWRTRCLEGKVCGFFNESGSEDGIHPSPGSCRGVLGSVVSRLRWSEPVPNNKDQYLTSPASMMEAKIFEESGRSAINQKKMISLASRPSTASVGTQTDMEETPSVIPTTSVGVQADLLEVSSVVVKKEVGCQTGSELEKERVMSSGSVQESMVVKLVCHHARMVPRGFWSSLSGIKCLECPDI